MFLFGFVCLLLVVINSKAGSIDIRSICYLPKDSGLQQAAVGAVKRWYYHSEIGQCEEFTFVPSGGNENNFKSEAQCISACMQDKKCNFGSPVKASTGRELFCGMGIKVDECPVNTFCKVHPTDAYAVCCPNCPKGQQPPNCISETPSRSYCPFGTPLKDTKGAEIFCGRGLNRQDCPKGSNCNIDPADRFAVCCPNRMKRNDEKKCPVGVPLKKNNAEVFCGRGPRHQDCPKGYACKIDPADRFAVCCKNSKST